jgi:cytochrome c oxidase subunit 3
MSSEVASFQQQRSFAYQVGWTILFVSIGMLFMTLFMMYGVFRYSQAMWPPMGVEKQPLIYSTISTILILLSSGTLERAHKRFKVSIKEYKSAMKVTIGLGILFLISQYFVWTDLTKRGLGVSEGIFPSILHGFTYIHWAHIVLALGALIWALKFKDIKETGELVNQTQFKNIVKCWHYLGIIWIILYGILFVF